ncbi:MULTISPECIES: hypothetical protein [Cupriavidus]
MDSWLRGQRLNFEVKGFKGNFKVKGFNFKVFNFKVNIKVKGFRAPGATYFLLSEKKVGQESGLPGRQGQKRWDFLLFLVSWWGRWSCLHPAVTGAGGRWVSGVVVSHSGSMMATAQVVQAAAATGTNGNDIGTALVSWWARWPPRKSPRH